MFEDSLVETSGGSRTKKATTLIMSVIVHAAVLATLILIPLLTATDALPTKQLMSMLVAPAPPPPPPPPPGPNIPEPKAVREIAVDPGAMVAPTAIPSEIAKIVDEAPTSSFGVPGGVGRSAGVGDVIQNMLKDQPAAAPPPPPPPPPLPPLPQPPRTRISGGVAQGNLIKPAAQPVYPPLAKQARVSGAVILDATISRDGTIENLRVVSGHPLLIPAAIEAVRQWRYRPTLLDGEPVEIMTTITVNFTLGS